MMSIQITKIVINSVMIPRVFIRISEKTKLGPVLTFLEITEIFVFT